MMGTIQKKIQKVHPQNTYICSLTNDFPNLAAVKGVVYYREPSVRVLVGKSDR